jgi:hypothetical protein
LSQFLYDLPPLTRKSSGVGHVERHFIVARSRGGRYVDANKPGTGGRSKQVLSRRARCRALKREESFGRCEECGCQFLNV